MAPPSPLRAPLDDLLAALHTLAIRFHKTVGASWTPKGTTLTLKSLSPSGNGFDTAFDTTALSAHERLAIAPVLDRIDMAFTTIMAAVSERPLLESALWNTKGYGHHGQKPIAWGLALRGQTKGTGKVRVHLGVHLHTPSGAHGVAPADVLDAFDAAWQAASKPRVKGQVLGV